jgi:hypothetical protein
VKSSRKKDFGRLREKKKKRRGEGGEGGIREGRVRSVRLALLGFFSSLRPKEA